MELSIRELNKKISRIQEDHSREIMKLSSHCEKELINMKKVNSCHEESIKKILLTLETNNYVPKKVSICRNIFTNHTLCIYQNSIFFNMKLTSAFQILVIMNLSKFKK